MKVKKLVWILISGCILSGSTLLFADFKEGETYYGFKLLEKRFVKEVNAECLYFEHTRSGARLFKIVADDANKTFSIAFKTVPQSDAGTPHIMEHAVLNGSKNFPVKSPFDVLSKGSLNTFLNAMTGKEITIYPVASMNNKDYFNLMHVYLDAVFNPLIYDDPRILKQEGWHHELMDKDSAVVYKGVVYNEMKGVYSNPSRELAYRIDKHLFPESSYRFSSGGYPPSIPTLTYEDFLDFHRRYYHPSNSYIFLYGDADLEKELAFIDTEYLSNYERLDERAFIPVQKPFEKIREASTYYAVPEGSDTTNQSYLTLSFVADLSTNQTLYMALEILQEVLVNQESAPVRLALQEAGIGREVRASLDDKKQNVFQIRVQNANPEDRDKFREIVMKTLREVKVEGLDEEAVEGILNRIEFRLREGDDAQKGLTYNFRGLTGWFFADDPFLSLEYEKPLADIKAKIKDGYLESVIQKYMLDNPHALVLVMQPKPGLEKENNARIDKELEEFKATLSAAEAETLVKETQELIAYQKREDSPEALATIPLLDIKDINPEAEWYDLIQMEVAEIPVLHHESFTNNVVYTRLYYDVRVLPAELIPYTAFLAELLGSLNTENYTYGELDKALNLHTGGFSTFLDTYLEDRSDDNLIPKFVVESKSMNHKVEKMFELIGEIINNTKYADKERLKAVLTRHQSRLNASIKQNGYGYARTRLISYFSNEGMFNELTGGVTYYKFVTDLLNNFDAKAETIIANLSKIATHLFTKENLIAAYTGSASDLQPFKDGLEVFSRTLPDKKMDYRNWTFEFEKKNEGMLSASKVQYVLKGYDFKKLGYQWNGKMRVLDQVISTDWLQNQVRVIGGAYGGWSSFSPTGRVYFASYRDPNLKETLENYNATPEYLHNFEADEKDMTRFIIGTIARMDRPLTPSQKGELAVSRYFYKTTKKEIQKEREAVIATTAEDIKEMGKLVRDVLAQATFCVYGNEQKIKAEKEVFGTVVSLSE